MKKFLKIVAGLMLVSTFAFAGHNSSNPNDSDGESLKMALYFDQSTGVVKTFYEKKLGANLEVTITDMKGRELTKRIVGKKRDVVRLNFNVSNLENGTYTIEVKQNDEVIRKKINVEHIDFDKRIRFNMKQV